jgi:hypothetical protein
MSNIELLLIVVVVLVDVGFVDAASPESLQPASTPGTGRLEESAKYWWPAQWASGSVVG